MELNLGQVSAEEALTNEEVIEKEQQRRGGEKHR